MDAKAIIFDLDGTLLDSLADIATAANEVLAAHDLPTYDLDAYRYFVGNGVRQLLHRILPARHRDDEAFARQLVAEFMERYQRSWNVQTRLYDGIAEMLDELVCRHIPLAVLSNKPQSATSQCVEFFLARYPFVAVLGQTSQRPPKPDLAGIQEILATLEVRASQCLYLGDTAVDMQTACLVGIPAIGVTWGFRDRAELESSGAHAIIDHPTELLPLVDAP